MSARIDNPELENEDLRDEVEAVLLWEERKNEDGQPLREFVASLEPSKVS